MREHESPLGTVKLKVKVATVQERTFDELVTSARASVPPANSLFLCINISTLDHDQSVALTQFLSQNGVVATMRVYLGGTDLDGPTGGS